MSKAKYPIHMQPSTAFNERVQQACALNWSLTGLEVVQHGRDSFSAHFMLKSYLGRRAQKVEIGPRPSLNELQDRVIEFLKA
jgi:hypothetical protein